MCVAPAIQFAGMKPTCDYPDYFDVCYSRLLTLLDAVGEPVSHTEFQKLLFLYTRECEVTPS